MNRKQVCMNRQRTADMNRVLHTHELQNIVLHYGNIYINFSHNADVIGDSWSVARIHVAQATIHGVSRFMPTARCRFMEHSEDSCRASDNSCHVVTIHANGTLAIHGVAKKGLTRNHG